MAAMAFVELVPGGNDCKRSIAKAKYFPGGIVMYTTSPNELFDLRSVTRTMHITLFRQTLIFSFVS